MAGINLRSEISFAGNSFASAFISTLTDAMALFGMPSNFAVSGSCTSTIPFFSFIAFNPKLPSLPMPERMMPILFSCWLSASERKNISIGSRKPRFSVGSNR